MAPAQPQEQPAAQAVQEGDDVADLDELPPYQEDDEPPEIQGGDGVPENEPQESESEPELRLSEEYEAEQARHLSQGLPGQN